MNAASPSPAAKARPIEVGRHVWLVRDGVRNLRVVVGYRGDVPFGELPKIEIEATPGEILAVADLDLRQPAESVELVPGGDDEIAVRVP